MSQKRRILLVDDDPNNVVSIRLALTKHDLPRERLEWEHDESLEVPHRVAAAVFSLVSVTPPFCAGITTYPPVRHWGVTGGKKVGVLGLGGLGHMAVRFARAFGAHGVVFMTSPNKKDLARRLGAHEVVLAGNADEMKKHAFSFDFTLDAVSAEHDINAYVNLLGRDGNLTLVGAPAKPLPVAAFGLILGRRSRSGSAIGGIAETQGMLDFCGKHNITADVEVIPSRRATKPTSDCSSPM